jgi:hypothetical protein
MVAKMLCELMDPLQHFSLVNNFLSGTDESSSFFYKKLHKPILSECSVCTAIDCVFVPRLLKPPHSLIVVVLKIIIT